MSTEIYKFVASPNITAYQIAQILEAGKLQLDAATYAQLPVELKVFFTPVTGSNQ